MLTLKITQPLQIATNVLPRLRQMTTYVAVGASSTTLDFVLFNALFLLFAPHHTFALVTLNGISTCGSVVNSYFGHRRWTFRSNQTSRAQLGTFIALNLIMLLVSVVLAGVFTMLLPTFMSASQTTIANLAKLLSLVTSGCLTFMGNKFLVFRS
ncbi:MAG: GtrA family protein [Herpetosiphon sp.]|nr:GtrA family protein [Herpetosiphon sp.]